MSLRHRSARRITRLRSEAPNRFVRRTHSRIITAGLASGVVVICMLVVRNGEVGDLERSVFQAINGLPDELQAPLWVLQIFGTLGFVAAAALLAFGLRRTRLGIALASLIPLKLAVEWWVIKQLVERERPLFTVPDALVRDVNTAPLGFPSGHAVFAFALAGLAAPYLGRRARATVWALALMNAAARVYLGAHNPLDVVAGAAVGIAIAAGLHLILGEPPVHSEAGRHPRRPAPLDRI